MKTFYLLGIALLGASAAFAQMEGPPPGPPGFKHGEFRPGGPHFGMHPGKVVTGAPYSATATEEFSQALAGGNSISRATTAQVARDSQGRTYTEQSMKGGPFASESAPKQVIFISDPAAGYDYVLHPDKKVAVRRTIPKPPAGDASGPNHRSEWRSGEGGPPEPGAEAPKAHPDEKVVTSTGTYQGLQVEIKTVTRTVPAGAMGNAQPIVSTRTTYYSPQLQTVVYSASNDPRFGQSKYSLSNISQSEPDAKLFVPPSDYALQDAPVMHEPR